VERLMRENGIHARRKRRHCSLGYRSPVQCLEHWLTTEEGQKRGA